MTVSRQGPSYEFNALINCGGIIGHNHLALFTILIKQSTTSLFGDQNFAAMQVYTLISLHIGADDGQDVRGREYIACSIMIVTQIFLLESCHQKQ